MPVFPATRKPFTRAFIPVPLSTTSSSMAAISRALVGLITRLTSSRCRSSSTLPSGATTRETMNGRSSSPPFAIAAIAITVCIPVAERPWPKETVSTAMSGMRAGSGSAPRASPGRPTKVRSPKPKARSAATSRCFPSASPIFAAQMLDDSRKTVAVVAHPILCVSCRTWPLCSQLPFSQ